MKYHNSNMLNCLLTLFILINVYPAYASDQLDTTSTLSHLAEQNLLLDIIRYQNNFVAVGERGHILIGKPDNWTQAANPSSTNLTAVDSHDDQLVAVGHDGIIIRSNDGKIWEKVFDGFHLLKLSKVQLDRELENTQHTLKQDPENEELLAEVEELQYAVEDIDIESKTGPSLPLLDVIFVSKKLIFAVGAYGTLLVSEDSGSNWALVSDRLDNPERLHLNNLGINDSGQLFIAGEGGLLFLSNDSGLTWEQIPVAYTISKPDLRCWGEYGKTLDQVCTEYTGSLFGVLAYGEQSILVYGLQGTVLRSHDLGQSWEKIKNSSSATIFSSTLTTDEILVVGQGGLIGKMTESAPELEVTRHSAGAHIASIISTEEGTLCVGTGGVFHCNQ
jgi:photosystem II stability/assembly factor-like uncharacterized protein